MPSVIDTMNQSCEMRHKDVITRSQVLGWIAGIAMVVIGTAMAWTMLQARVAFLEAETSRQAEVLEAQAEYVGRMDNRLVELRNDMGWQMEMTRLIARKLDVIVPARVE